MNDEPVTRYSEKLIAITSAKLERAAVVRYLRGMAEAAHLRRGLRNARGMVAALCDRIAEGRAEARGASAQCYDCSRQYGDEHGFSDLVIPLEAWESISPTGDEGGLLCPSCICARLHKAGMRDVPASFMSGPVRAVDSVLMTAYRHVENLRLGRDYSISERARRLLGIEGGEP